MWHCKPVRYCITALNCKPSLVCMGMLLDCTATICNLLILIWYNWLSSHWICIMKTSAIFLTNLLNAMWSVWTIEPFEPFLFHVFILQTANVLGKMQSDATIAFLDDNPLVPHQINWHCLAVLQCCFFFLMRWMKKRWMVIAFKCSYKELLVAFVNEHNQHDQISCLYYSFVLKSALDLFLTGFITFLVTYPQPPHSKESLRCLPSKNYLLRPVEGCSPSLCASRQTSNKRNGVGGSLTHLRKWGNE